VARGTGVGSRQAGYLLESVLNPNALMVDDPGYIASSASTVNQGDRWSAKPAKLVKR
jgi:hypothetical protein